MTISYADHQFIAKPYKSAYRVYNSTFGSFPVLHPAMPYREQGIDSEKGLPDYASEAECEAMATALTLHFMTKGRVKSAPDEKGKGRKQSAFEDSIDAMSSAIKESM